MNQRIIFFICILMVGCNILCAQKFKKVNDQGVEIKYRVISAPEKTVQVTEGIVRGQGELIIPATVENNGTVYRVTSIKSDACIYAKRLVLPEGLVEIGQRAFMGNYSKDFYQDIYIPTTVKYIGKNAFSRHVGFGICAARTCNLECLPSFVDVTTCEEYGLSKGSVASYWATHGSKEGLAQSITNNAQAQQQGSPFVEQPKAPSSDVDVDIPQGNVNNENTFAVIFANENYQEEVNVDYALNDGEMFKTYCQKVLGVPEENVHIRKDATLNNIKAELSWLQKVADAYKGQARFIVYYAGHGIPDEKTGTSYLLPVDGKGNMLETGYSLERLYAQLGEMPSAGVTVFMDACFSGSKRGDGMLASARGVAIKAKPQTPQGKMVVFSAAQGDETAYPFKEKEHGLFTYYLLKKLKETNGNVSLGELGEFITDQVSRKSIVANGKSQTPSIVFSEIIGENWKGKKLK